MARLGRAQPFKPHVGAPLGIYYFRTLAPWLSATRVHYAAAVAAAVRRATPSRHVANTFTYPPPVVPTIKNYYTGGVSAAKRLLRGLGF